MLASFSIAGDLVLDRAGSIVRTNEMPDVQPNEIVGDVRDVLKEAAKGKGPNATTKYLTAYQILNRLRPDLRDQLISERGRGGTGEGVHYAAPSVVAMAAQMVCQETGGAIDYIDTTGLQVEIDNQFVEPSYEICGLYRFRA